MNVRGLRTRVRRESLFVALVILTTALLVGCAPSGSGSRGSSGAEPGVAWQPRESGLPAFYYFGDPG